MIQSLTGPRVGCQIWPRESRNLIGPLTVELSTEVNCCETNLVPRVHWLFGQREGASRDSGIMEFFIPENVGFRF